MKTVKRLLSCSLVSSVAAALMLMSCANSPKKPEWVERGAERDTSGGMIRHYGLGTDVASKDVALFNARQNAIQATQQECAGISLKRTVPRKTWVESVYDENNDEKFLHFQAHAVVEVSEDDCEKAQTPGKSQAEEMGVNARVDGQQDIYEREIQIKAGLPDDYYLKQRAMAQAFATKDDMQIALEKEGRDRMADRAEMIKLIEDNTGKSGILFAQTMKEPCWKNPELKECMYDEEKAKARMACNTELAISRGFVDGKVAEYQDKAHPSTLPFWELYNRQARRCAALEAGQLVEAYDFEKEQGDARMASRDIVSGLAVEVRRVGQELPADKPHLFPGTPEFEALHAEPKKLPSFSPSEHAEAEMNAEIEDAESQRISSENYGRESALRLDRLRKEAQDIQRRLASPKK